MASEQAIVEVDGHRLTLTNLDKVLYPQTGTTKAEVLRYYTLIAATILPVVAGRPVTRKRWPNGVASEPFFVKNTETGAPSWIRRVTVPHSDRPVTYPLIDSSAVLIWLAQMAALELHVPQWRFVSDAADATAMKPDRMVFDLDPGQGATLADCVQVAGWVREVLQQAGSDAVPVTSGSKGLHLYVPLDGARTSDEVSAIAKAVAQALESDHPTLVTSKMSTALRANKVFIDWSQNNGAKTTIAPYSLRGRERPTVAVPRTWDELADPDLHHLDLSEVLQRLESGIEPWTGSGLDFQSWTGEESADRSPGGLEQGTMSTPPGLSDAQLQSAADYANGAAQHLTVGGGYLSGGDQYGGKKYGGHRWQDPLEGPRGRVVRREVGGRRPVGGDASVNEPAAAKPSKPVGLHVVRGPVPTLRPMLASPGNALDLGDASKWRFEGKWDGIRALAQVADGTVTLIGRSGRDLTAGYPELAELVDAVGDHGVLLDGEIVAIDADGRTSFPLMQQRMNVTLPQQIARMSRQVPVRYFAFDLLWLDGKSLLDFGYDNRRRLLLALDLVGEHLEVPAQLDGDLGQALRFTREQQWEGLVAKRGDGAYRPGTRSGGWLKIKNQRTQEVVIVGWRPGQGRRSDTVGSLLTAIPDDDGVLHYTGRVGTGFTDRALADLAALLSPVDDCAATGVPAADARTARFTDPTLVGEVSFVEWTPDGRMRAPSWRGLRPDKNPGEVRRES